MPKLNIALDCLGVFLLGKRERKKPHSIKDLLLIIVLKLCEIRHCRHIASFIKQYYGPSPLFINSFDSR